MRRGVWAGLVGATCAAPGAWLGQWIGGSATTAGLGAAIGAVSGAFAGWLAVGRDVRAQRLSLTPEAERAVSELTEEFADVLHADADASSQGEIGEKDIRTAYIQRRSRVWEKSLARGGLVRRVGRMTYAGASFLLALIAFHPPPSAAAINVLNTVGALAAGYGTIPVFFKEALQPRRRAGGSRQPAQGQRGGQPIDPDGPVAQKLQDYSEKLAQEVRKEAQYEAAKEKRRKAAITEQEILSAGQVFGIAPAAAISVAPESWSRPATPKVRSRSELVVHVLMPLAVAAVIYAVFAIAVPKLPLSNWQAGLIVAAGLIILYLAVFIARRGWRKNQKAIINAFKSAGGFFSQIPQWLALPAEAVSRKPKAAEGINGLDDRGKERPMRTTKSIVGSTWPMLLFALIVLGAGLSTMAIMSRDVTAGAITALVTAVLGVVGTHVGHVAGHELAARQLAAQPPLASLEQLAQLHANGKLSDDEFTAAKRKLLG